MSGAQELGALILSAVFVGLVAYLYDQYQETRTAERNHAIVRRMMDAEDRKARTEQPTFDAVHYGPRQERR